MTLASEPMGALGWCGGNMSGRTKRSTRLLSLLAALGAITVLATHHLPAGAHEPDGVVAFESGGVTAAPENALGFTPGEKLVRLTIRSVRDLDGVFVTHAAPEGIAQRLATVQTADAGARAIDPDDGESPARIEIGKLKAGAIVVLEFSEDFAEGTGGVVTFSVEAIGADGKIYHEAYGQVVGTPGTPGVERNGAIEFPAHQLPPETKP
jgi:hypothetical protein